MLSRKRFKTYVKDYIEFEKFVDRVYKCCSFDLNENEEVEKILSSYDEMLNSLMCIDYEADETIVDDLLWEDYCNVDDEDIDGVYDQIINNFYSVDDGEDGDETIDKILSRPTLEELVELLSNVKKEQEEGLYEIWLDYLLP